MPASHQPRREQLYEAFILHHRPYRDTSRILEVLTRDFGRMTLFARGARGAKSRLASILMPFQPLLVSWSGRGEAGQLTRAELGPAATEAALTRLPPAALMPAYYLNELLLRLTTRHDPLPVVFELYRAALRDLHDESQLLRALRLFEKRLLETLGYGVELDHDAAGAPLRAALCYRYDASNGFVVVDRSLDPQAIDGAAIAALAAEDLSNSGTLEAARLILRAALAPLLDGRELATRSVARAVARGSRG